jgi:hypothetical protein
MMNLPRTTAKAETIGQTIPQVMGAKATLRASFRKIGSPIMINDPTGG